MLHGLYGLISLVSALPEDPFPPLPKGVITALGPTVVVTEEVFEYLPLDGLSYFVIGNSPVVRRTTTGATVMGGVPNTVQQLKRIWIQPGWLSRGLVVVVAREPDIGLFRQSWSHKTPNVLYHTPRGVFAYNPFTDAVFRVKDTSRIRKLLLRRWNDLHGHPIIVDIYKHGLGFLEGRSISLGAGIDASALYELSKYWNMTIQLYNPNSFEGDYNADSADKHLLAEKTELSMNARFMIKASEQVYLEYTTTVFADSVVIVMRRPTKLRGWEIFFRTLEWKVWLAILVTLIVMNRFLRLISGNKKCGSVLVLTLRSVFAIPVRRQPVRTSQRWAISGALFASTVLINSYTANLYHLMQSAETIGNPNTLMEVYKMGLPLLAIRSGMNEYFEMRESKEVKELGKSIQVKQEINDELLQHNAYVMREKEMRLLMDTNMIRRDIHFVKEKVLSFTMAYVVKRGSPFLGPLSVFTSLAFEAGLHEYWYTATVVRFEEEVSQNVSHRIESSEARGLTISDVEIAFFCLLLGQMISLMVFLMELLVDHIVKRKFYYTKKVIDKIALYFPQENIESSQ